MRDVHARPVRPVGGGRRGRRLGWQSVVVLPVLLLAVFGASPVAAAGPIDQYIVGGTAVPDGAYRFQAALLGQTFGSDDWERQFCGGSLIGPDQVLTAAHCVDFIGDGPGDELRLEDLRVVVGRTVLTSDQGQKRRAVRIDIHPSWDPDSSRFDAAVITLASPITGIKPIQLVTSGSDALERPGSIVLATGWGNTIAQPVGPGPGGVHYAYRMRVVSLPVLSRTDCETSYTIDGISYVDTKTMICAGKTGKDTCQGDSGGPLFLKATSGGYVQLGITSWGAGCAATGFPGVYTRLGNGSIGHFIQVAAGGV